MQNKLKAIRNFLTKENIDAVILRHGDEYFNEEVCPHNQVFKWLTGLDVSYGYAVVSNSSATLFVDGRYIFAAQEALDRNVWTVNNIKKTPLLHWMVNNAIGKTAIDPNVHTINEVNDLIRAANGCLEVVFFDELVNCFWKDRPKAEKSQISHHSIEFAGESVESKILKISAHLNRVLAELTISEDFLGETKWRTAAYTDVHEDPSTESTTKIPDRGKLCENSKWNCGAILIADPCDVAWVMNIRGNSLKYTPIALARMIVFSDGSFKIYTDSCGTDIGIDGKIFPAKQIFPDIAGLKGRLLIDPSNTPYKIKTQAEIGAVKTIFKPCIVQNLKSIKNEAELNGARSSHILDGVAVTSLLYWLHKEINSGNDVFEADVSEKIMQIRARNDLYAGESFSCIAAFGKNAANVHYKISDRGDKLSNNGLFLLDTGGQYRCGTTDVTRTLSLGWPNLEEQDAFTRVLKGHIALASTVFPAGTTGYQLDCLARQHLWQVGLDYDHGTGHGIGSYLGVHEGPQNFSKKSSSDNTLRAGMLITIEPGYYSQNKFGIRIENVNQVIALTNKEDGEEFLTFAALTAVPMDFKLIMPALLSEQEKIWLKNYHEWVLNTLLPHLDEEVKSWLIEQINPYFNIL